jgi:hypothetical protein
MPKIAKSVSSDLEMKALIIYDDFASAARANTTLQNIGRRVKVRWAIKPWQTNILREGIPARNALVEAVDAHLILFAWPRTNTVPFWIRDWLKQWVAIRQIPDAAVALMDERIGFAPEEESELALLACQFGLEFITDDSAIPRSTSKLPVHFAPNEELALPVERWRFAEPPANQSHRFAGIND